MSHALMWLIFTFLVLLNYYYGYQFEFQSSLLFSVRMTLCNMSVFYIFFYMVVPYTFNRNYIILFIVSVPLLIQLWLAINHYFYKFLYINDIQPDFGVLKDLLKENYNTPVSEIISLRNVLGHLFEVIMALSPFFFIKITFDLSKTYAKSVKAQRQIEKLNYENLLMENKFLQTQLNPHFLFNTLNNLYALTLKKDDLAPEVILKLSEIMRYTLYETNANVVYVEKELEFIDNYYEMERMRYPDDYHIEKKINNDHLFNLEIAPLLSFVFIENAFKYGLKSENPFLSIMIEIKGKNIHFIIENDVSEINKKAGNNGGIGIENAKRRLKLLYPDKHTLDIKNDGKRFLVQLKINLH